MSANTGEDAWEQLVIDAMRELDWEYTPGAEVAPGSGERESWQDIVLRGTLDTALKNLNPEVPAEYLHQAAAEVLTPQSQDAITENFRLHQILRDGYRGITYVDHDGRERSPVIRFLSGNVAENSYRVVNQVTMRRGQVERRFDVVAYVNGLPLVIMELKQAGSRSATAEAAFNQLQTYVAELPMAFRFTAFVVASDGINARYGTQFTPWNHFASWNVDDDGRPVAIGEPGPDGEILTEIDWTLNGLFNLDRFGQLIHDFVAFDEDAAGLTKRIAKPHQYFAVTKAVGSTISAVRADGKIGVVWHTQGSGKSMEMELYTAKVMGHPQLANPTIVVLTDRTELDTQLFDGFQRSTLLPEQPRQVSRREELRSQLSERRTGGIYFTTLQKFGLSQAEKEAGAKHPLLSDRRNIIVIADEAHRSHYGDLDGYARHLRSALPNAALIAFTGTPIREADRDTRQVFGADIDVYDLRRAVDDNATVPVYFEPRLIQLARLDGARRRHHRRCRRGGDHRAGRSRQAAPPTVRRRARSPLRRPRAPPPPSRRTSSSTGSGDGTTCGPSIEGPGKAMIVTATRSIAARLYDEIVALRPDWHDEADAKGKIKVVYTANPSDPDLIKTHMRRPSAIASIKQRVKDPADELEIVIVKDMMLTGFDAPALHTLYLDRSIKGALLMQTLARVNRTYKGKQDGLLVAYAPLLENLNAALREFTHEVDATDPSAGRRDVDEAAQLVHTLVGSLREIVTLDWKSDPERGRAPRLHQRRLRDHELPALPAHRGQHRPRGPGGAAPGRRLPRPLGEARPRLGARRRARRHPGAAARGAVLQGGARLDGEVRRARPHLPRRARHRRGAAPARRAAGRLRREHRRGGHLPGGRARPPAPRRDHARLGRGGEEALEVAARDRGAEGQHPRGGRAGDPRQRGALEAVLRADQRTDAEVHQQAAHRRRGHRPAHRDGPGGQRRSRSRSAVQPAARHR